MVSWMEAVEELLQQEFFLCLLFEASAGCGVSPRRRPIWGRIGRGWPLPCPWLDTSVSWLWLRITGLWGQVSWALSDRDHLSTDRSLGRYQKEQPKSSNPRAAHVCFRGPEQNVGLLWASQAKI